ncbi:MAG: hypothetical protein J5825_05550 [Lachnospiraceae bacterium]|nr:hypothetical protein [Lachnospiraceae bacterium]
MTGTLIALSIIALTIKPYQIVLIVLTLLTIAAFIFLTIWGKKLEKKQNLAKAQMDAMAQTAQVFVIKKEKKKFKEAKLPAQVLEQVPKYMKNRKVSTATVKVGPKIVTMMVDDKVFEILPEKANCTIVVSGIYITELKAIRGQKTLPKPPEPKGAFNKMRAKLSGFVQSTNEENEKAKAEASKQHKATPTVHTKGSKKKK